MSFALGFGLRRDRIGIGPIAPPGRKVVGHRQVEPFQLLSLTPSVFMDAPPPAHLALELLAAENDPRALAKDPLQGKPRGDLNPLKVHQGVNG
jgi:hypothetical protein